ncbi:MAG: ISAs1 family transposase [Tatlockia sp.]|jgi:predicted transposase YbfD/YdcC|nr:ISAs1 family transposase [Tatlockia sp.]
MLPCQEDNRSFFEKLQKAEGLDLRDNRGKRHDLAVILVGVTIAILSNRDGCLSSIHRHLKNHYEKLVAALRVEKIRPVSRSQLPLILEKVAVEVFDQLLFENFGVKLNGGERRWFAFDGKQMRGSIETGDKRGEVIVQAVSHANRRVGAQGYYSGLKESEILTVRKLLDKSGISSEKVSLDALHCNPETLELIAESKGKYLVGLKENQKELKKQFGREIEKQSVLFKTGGVEKGHGRIETRKYEFYDLLEMEKDERWKKCQIKTLIKVNRERTNQKSGKSSLEESYYVSNEVGKYEELSEAVRNHWQVETNNHLRDVSLKEDEMRSKKRSYRKQWQE